MNIKNIVRKTAIGVGAFIVGGVLLVALALCAARSWNDTLLSKMENSLSDMDVHPRDSEVVKTYRFFGSRYTNTNECTFAVGQWRVSKLDSNALRKQYINQTVSIPWNVKNIPLGFALIEEDSHLTLEDPPDNWHTVIREQVDNIAKGYTHYLLYLYLRDRSSFGDERCFEGNVVDTETRDLTQRAI